MNNPTKVAFLVCLMLALAAAGCGTVRPPLAPTPAVLKDPRIAFERMLAPDMRTTRLPAYLATRREASGGPEHFGDGTAKAVALGVARVRLGEPDWTWEDLLASHAASSVDHPGNGAVESVQVFGAAGAGEALSDADRAFVAAIDNQLALTTNQQVIVYVHGYRVTFDEVAVQMGSFSHYLGQGATVTFQWPTGTMF